MTDPFLDYVEADFDAGEMVTSSPTLESTIRQAIDVIRITLNRYQNPALLWTGGKDSTLVLSIAVQVADELGVDPPMAVFPDHLQHFTEINAFVECWTEEWGLDLVIARNDSVERIVREQSIDPGEAVPIDELSDRNRWHVRRILGYEEETFPFLLEIPVADYLLRELPLNDTLDDYEIDALITGTRWAPDTRSDDESEAATAGHKSVENGKEIFFSPRCSSDLSPPHHRVNPILPFGEQDVWNAFFTHVFPNTIDGYPDGHVPNSPADLPDEIEPASLPIPSLYFDGFRSLGSEAPPVRPDDTPAWNQTQESVETSAESHATSGCSYETTEGFDADRARESAKSTDESDRRGLL